MILLIDASDRHLGECPILFTSLKKAFRIAAILNTFLSNTIRIVTILNALLVRQTMIKKNYNCASLPPMFIPGASIPLLLDTSPPFPPGAPLPHPSAMPVLQPRLHPQQRPSRRSFLTRSTALSSAAPISMIIMMSQIFISISPTALTPLYTR